jgi:GDP-L-fucose synthase
MAAAYHAQYGFSTISLMPTNLYGPGDNFDLETSHVLPAMIRRFHEAKSSGAASVTLWGTGTPRREFLHVNDLADAACFLMDKYDGTDLLNVGVGEDLTIAELAEMVARVVGYDGRIVFDPLRPDGSPRKLLDVTRIHALGWKARIPLEKGIGMTYAWYLSNSAFVSA